MCRNEAPAHRLVFREGQFADHGAVLIIVALPGGHQVGLADLQHELSPYNRRVRLGRQGELIHLHAAPLAFKREGDEVVTREETLFDEIVVRKMTAHPGGHQHRGGNFDRAVHLRQVVPDVVGDFEGGGARFFLRFGDANERVLRPQRPNLQSKGALPVGGGDLHGDRADAGFAPQQAIHLIDDLARPLIFPGRSARART